MSEDDFYEQLKTAIQDQKEFIQKEELTALKSDLSYFFSSYNTLYKLLLKNKLVMEDAYRDAIKISDIKVPPTTPFPENKAKEELTIRLSLYDTHLEFLLNYCPISFDYLTPERIKMLASFVKFIQWENLMPGSNDCNTQQLALMIEKLSSNSSHDLTSQIVKDSKSQLAKYSKSIIKHLKALSDFNRENYKFEIRDKVINGMKRITQSEYDNGADDVVTRIQKDFFIVFPNKPFYADLVKEIIVEDFDSDKASHRKDLMNKLNARPTKEKNEQTNRPIEHLQKAVKILSGCDSLLTECLIKLDGNYMLSRGRKMTLTERFLLLLGILKKDDREKSCEIEFIEENSGISKKQLVSLNKFEERQKDLIQKVTNLSLQMSKMSEMDKQQEEMFLDQFNGCIQEYIKTTKYLTAFNDFFKKKATMDSKLSPKGISIEINGIKTCISSARKLRNDYETLKDEEKLFKTILGSKTSSSND